MLLLNKINGEVPKIQKNDQIKNLLFQNFFKKGYRNHKILFELP